MPLLRRELGLGLDEGLYMDGSYANNARVRDRLGDPVVLVVVGYHYWWEWRQVGVKTSLLSGKECMQPRAYAM